MKYQQQPPWDDKTSPFFLQKKVKLFREKTKLTSDLISDEADSIIKEAGEEYLIRRPDKVESQAAYDKRLESAVLVNAYADGIDSYADMVGAAGITLSDEARSDRTEAVFAQADRTGNSLETFAGKVFREGVGEGVSFMVVDGPGKQGVVTRSEAASAGIRPWLSCFGPDQLLGWNENDGQLLSVRYYWVETTEGTGYSEEVEWKAREYALENDMVVSRTWTWTDSLSAPEEVMLSIKSIPVIPFLPGSEVGLMLSYPPAARLAHMTMAYYNSWSLQQNFGVIARTPLLTVIGATVKEVLHSLASVFSLDGHKSDIEARYVEPTSVGAEFGWKDLEKIENAFRYWGVELERQNGTVLATTKTIDNNRVVEKVRAWSGELEKSLQRVLEVYEDYYQETFPDNGVSVGTEYGVPSLTNEQVQLIKLVSDAQGIGGEQLLELLKIYVPQLNDVSWEDVQDSLIQTDQTTTLTGLDTGTPL